MLFYLLTYKNMNLNNVDITKYKDIAIEWLMSYTPKIIGALITIWIWFKIINFIVKVTDKALKKAKVEKALKSFVESMISAILKVLLLLTAAWMVGIETTSFIAILGAAGLAIGMALSGTLQNFAGWVMILLFKPFKLWDFIEVAGYAWVINEIHIFNTYILTWDKKTIIIPNSQISGSSLINYSKEPKRRIDLEVWIAYNDSIDKAKEVLEKIAKNDEKVLSNEWITIWVSSLWDNAVILAFRVFIKSEDYWPTFFRLNETIKKEFDKAWLNFPFPQRDVHIYNEK